MKKSDFEEIYSKTRWLHREFLALKYIDREENEIGIIASKKLGNAVIRNRIRRRIKEIAKKMIEGKHLGIIFLAKNGIEKLRYLEIKTAVSSILKAAKIID